MLPGAKLTLTEEWDGLPPFDPLTAHVSATATDPNTTRHISTAASAQFWYFPWILVLIILVLIAGAIYLIVRRRRRKATGDGAVPSQEGESGSDGPPPPTSTSDRGSLEGAGI
jgi:H+/Cl- antiporter ClcA